MSDTDEFTRALRSEVLRVAGTLDQPAPHRHRHRPQRPRRHRRRFDVTAGVVAALAAVLTLVFGVDPAGAGVDITRDGDDLVVTLIDLNTSPDDIVAAARDAGLDVHVDAVPTGPSKVGQFVSADGSQLPPELRKLGENDQGAFDGFRIPADWDERIELQLGRAARPGEPWSEYTLVNGPGEPLACEPVGGERLDDVLGRLGDVGLTDVQVSVIDVDGVQPQWSDHPDATVVRAMRVSDDKVLVDAITDAVSIPEEPTGMDPAC